MGAVRRRRGSGSISARPDGRHLVQIVADDGRRVSLGLFGSREEAEAVLDAATVELHEGAQRDGVTLEVWGRVALDRRERHGVRGIEQERARWRAHVAGTELASLPLRQIERADVQRWLDRLLVTRARGSRGAGQIVSRRTALNALTLVRSVLEDALQRGALKSNPASDVRPPRARGRTEEEWTYLTPEEQARLLAACPLHIRPTVAFALGSGLRQGEQWALELADVHLDAPVPHVVVRYGSPGQPTKSGKIRRVDLVPVAVDAARAQLDLLDELELAARRRVRGYRDPNHGRLLFPSLRGSHRQRGAPAGWEGWVQAAELGRTVRWHDLRHTCASSLVAGWWGRSWTLLEVRALLGHSTIAVTERYAHLAGTITQAAAAATPGAPYATGTQRAEGGKSRKPRSHLRGLNSRPTVYESEAVVSKIQHLRPPRATEVAYEVLRLAAAGDPRCTSRGIELAELVIGAAPKSRSRVG
jgi:integrase